MGRAARLRADARPVTGSRSCPARRPRRIRRDGRGRIGVTGATGGLGGRVAARLADHGVPQRLLVPRRRAGARTWSTPRSRRSAATTTPTACARALEGIDTLFLVSAAEDRDRVVAAPRRMVDAAVAAGVGRIVYTSFLGAAPDCTFTFGRDHFHTEEHIRATGVAPHVPARQPLPRLHPRSVRAPTA